MNGNNVAWSFEAECSVLGSILEKPELMDMCLLKNTDFFDQRHKKIMEWFIYLVDIGSEIDLTILIAYAETAKDIDDMGGVTYIAGLQSNLITVHNFKQHQKIILELSRIRQALDIMRLRSSESGSTLDSIEYITGTIEALERLSEDVESDSEPILLGDVLDDHEDIIVSRKNVHGLTGIKTCSSDLDLLTGGWQKGDLIIMAARPSMGKTAAMLNDAFKGQRDARIRKVEGSAALIYSIEQKELPIAERMICLIGSLDSRNLKSGNMSEKDWDKYRAAKGEIKSLPIFINDKSHITLQQIRRTAKTMIKTYPNLILFIDYLQLIDCGNSKINHDDTKNSKAVSKGLKRIAKDLNIPVVCISAVGRDVEKRQDKRPMMSDLRESGSIESDADVIIFLYRDDYYNSETEKKGLIEIIVAKGRDIGIGLIEMLYIRSTSRFIDLDRKVGEPHAA